MCYTASPGQCVTVCQMNFRQICNRQSTINKHGTTVNFLSRSSKMGHWGGRGLWTPDVCGQDQPFCSDTAASPPAIADSACIQRPKVKVMLKRRQWRDDESWEKDGMTVFMPRSLTQHSWQNAHTHTYIYENKINSAFINRPKIWGAECFKMVFLIIIF